MPGRTILIHADAPPKPAAGQACNGCGVCCQWQPCPIGILVSRRLNGPCRALRWQPAERRYRCGLMAHATPARNGPRSAGGWAARLALRLVRRWIAAGQGCDSDLQANPGATTPG